MPVSVSFQIENAGKVRAALEKLRLAAPKATAEEMQTALTKAAGELSSEPSKPSYPVNWDSNKQRMAFFATKGFGGGIPYARTGRISKQWIIQNNTSSVRLSNKAPQAVYVYGTWESTKQSRIHKGRWPVFQIVVKKYIGSTGEKLVNPIQRAITRLINWLGL